LLRSSKSISFGADGLLIGVNTNAPEATNVNITWTPGGIGVSDSATGQLGELAPPFAAQFQFKSRRMMRSIVLGNFDPASESATLVALNRDTGQRDMVLIKIDDANSNLTTRTAAGFDTYELRPDSNSRFGVVSFESSLPEPTMLETTLSASDMTASAPGDALLIAGVAGGVIALMLLLFSVAICVALYLRKRREEGSNEEPASAINYPPPQELVAVTRTAAIAGREEYAQTASVLQSKTATSAYGAFTHAEGAVEGDV